MNVGDRVVTKSGRKGKVCQPPFEMPGYVLVDFGTVKNWVILEAIKQGHE